MERESINRQADFYVFACFLMLLLLAPIPFGSNRPWAAMLLVVASAALLLVWCLLYFRRLVVLPESFPKALWPLSFLFLFQVWVLFQSLVLPESWVRFLSPTAYHYYAETGESFRLSVYSNETLKLFLSGLGLCFSFLLSLLLINSRERIDLFVKALVVSGVIQVSIGLVLMTVNHELVTDLKAQFFPLASASASSGTFVNSNHFAGYLNICLAMGVGLLLRQISLQKKITWKRYFRQWIETILGEKTRYRIFLLVLVAGLLMSGSRMGNAAFMFALLLTSGLFFLLQNKFNFKAALFLLSLIVFDTFVVGTWFGLGRVVEQIEDTNFKQNTRIEINQSSTQIIKDFYLTGAGAGAYGVLEPAYNRSPSAALTEHAHNDYFEFLIHTGVVGMFILGTFLLWILKTLLFETVHGRLRLKKKLDYGLVMLLAYTAIHSAVDFNLFIPAFAFTLMACLALVFMDESVSAQNNKKDMGLA